jgi:hypothetical protein
MPAATITPAMGSLPTSEADLSGTTVSTNEEWVFDIRCTNITASSVTIRIAVSDGASAIRYLAYDYTLPAYTSVDVYRALVLPAGYRIRGRAGTTTAVDYVITASKRSTV